MSEEPAAYMGIRALQTGYEEGQAWRDLALALLTPAQRRALQVVIEVGPYNLVEGWCWGSSIAHALRGDQQRTYDALLMLPDMLVDRLYAPDGVMGSVRLTPFGAQVAAALK